MPPARTSNIARSGIQLVLVCGKRAPGVRKPTP
jgi:hypothetical protein